MLQQLCAFLSHVNKFWATLGDISTYQGAGRHLCIVHGSNMHRSWKHGKVWGFQKCFSGPEKSRNLAKLAQTTWKTVSQVIKNRRNWDI